MDVRPLTGSSTLTSRPRLKAFSNRSVSLSKLLPTEDIEGIARSSTSSKPVPPAAAARMALLAALRRTRCGRGPLLTGSSSIHGAGGAMPSKVAAVTAWSCKRRR